MPLDILFCDNHQLVINKPAGLLTQPSGTAQDSLEAFAKQWVKEEFHKPGNVFLEAIHRLDKPVSGIVLFARTSKALSRLQACMREKRSRKLYTAVVEGLLPSQTGILEHYLVHDEFQAQVVTKNTPQAKHARLTYRVVEEKEGCSILEVQLDTGRYHQIRAQLSAIGHPIIGDRKYGSKHPYEEGAIMLHHSRLEIPHPITNDLQVFNSPFIPVADM